MRFLEFNWLKRLKGADIGQHAITPIISLLPGVYYRLVFEPEFHVSFVGEEIYELLGYKAKELQNINTIKYLRLVHPDHEKILEQKRNLCIQSRNAKKIEYHLSPKSGLSKFVEDNFIGEYDNEGRLIAVNGYLKEKKKSPARLQLHKQLEAYRAAIDVNIISSITDSKGIIIYANENFKKVSRYDDDEILGKTHRIVSSGYHPRSFFENMWRTISSGKMWSGEILNRAKDGTLYWVDTVIIPTFDDRNRITSYLSLRMLITERKRAEEQREKYIQVLEEIAHVVAHDLRGPVCSILGLTNIFKKSHCEHPETKQAIDYLIYAANKLDQISRQLSASIYAADLEMKGEGAVQPLYVSSNENEVENQNNKKNSLIP